MKKLLTAWWLLLLCPFSQLQADTETQLYQRLQAMQSLTAQYVQIVRDERGAVLQEASGQFYMQRPNKLRWETQQPYAHLLISDGLSLWLYDIDLQQVSQQPFDQALAQTPGALLSAGGETLAEQYQVQYQAADSPSAMDSFELLPHDPQAMFMRLSLRFNGAMLVQMELLDHFQQTTLFIFEQQQVNTELSPELFQFTPPSGVDVIHHDR